MNYKERYMKNIYKTFGIIFMVMMIGLVLGCPNDTDGGGDLTLSGLNDYNGNYVLAKGEDDVSLYLLAAENINQDFSATAAKISKGNVKLTVWDISDVIDSGDTDKMKKYSGTASNVFLWMVILEKKNLTGTEFEALLDGDFSLAVGFAVATVSFTNGKAEGTVTVVESFD